MTHKNIPFTKVKGFKKVVRYGNAAAAIIFLFFTLKWRIWPFPPSSAFAHSYLPFFQQKLPYHKICLSFYNYPPAAKNRMGHTVHAWHSESNSGIWPDLIFALLEWMLLLVHTWCPTLICEVDGVRTTLALSKFAGSFNCDLFMVSIFSQNTHLAEPCGLNRVPACTSSSGTNHSL